MSKSLFIIGIIFVLCGIYHNEIYGLWYENTALKAYNAETLYLALDEVKYQPFWKAKAIIMTGNITFSMGQRLHVPSNVTLEFRENVTSSIYPEWFGAEKGRNMK